MDGLPARLDSFKKSKRVKNPNKSSTTTLKWPHPSNFFPNPETLAEAGFYYDPSYDDPDNVTCFNCEKQLAGWEEDDDPYLIHWNKCSQTCCWAVVQCGLRVDMDRSGKFVFPDKTRLPNQKAMEKARLETFTLGKGWIHDKTRNHGANSKSMARAGFVYAPQKSGDDLATCLYCNVSLSGWDEDDDPMEEHRKRATKSDSSCPFFEHTESRQAKPSSTKTPSRSSSKPPSRAKSKKLQDVVVSLKTSEDESEVAQAHSTGGDILSNDPSKSSGATPAAPPDKQAEKEKRKPGRPRKTRATAEAKSKQASKVVEVSTDKDDDPMEEDPQHATKSDLEPTESRRSTKPQRPSRKSKKPLDMVPSNAEMEDESEAPPEKEKRKLGRPPKTKATAEAEAKPKQTSKVVEISTEKDDKLMEKRETESRQTKPPSTSKRPSRKSKKPPLKTSDGEESDAPRAPSETRGEVLLSEAATLAPPDKEKRKPGRPPRTKANEVSTDNDDDPKEERDLEHTESNPPSSSKRPSRQSKKPPLKTSDYEMEDDVPQSHSIQRDSLPSELAPPEKQQQEQEPETKSHPPKKTRQIVEVSSDEDQEVSKPLSPPPLIADQPITEKTRSVVIIEDVIMHEEPQTPSASKPNPEPEPELESNVYLPPLSRLPFMPIRRLEEAELDMTVEEWIRYHIEVEQDRFKRDGERELDRFQKRAEEVRGVIDGL